MKTFEVKFKSDSIPTVFSLEELMDNFIFPGRVKRIIHQIAVNESVLCDQCYSIVRIS